MREDEAQQESARTSLLRAFGSRRSACAVVFGSVRVCDGHTERERTWKTEQETFASSSSSFSPRHRAVALSRSSPKGPHLSAALSICLDLMPSRRRRLVAEKLRTSGSTQRARAPRFACARSSSSARRTGVALLGLGT